MHLERIDDGPVPPHYNDLQGIGFLEAAFIGAEKPPSLDRHAVRTLLQSFDLLCMGCADLCRRQCGHSLPNQMPRFHQHAAWHVAFLRYAVSLVEHALSYAAPENARVFARCGSTSFSEYFETHDAVSRGYLDYLHATPDALAKLPYGMLCNSDAGTIQHVKNIYLLQQMLLSRLNALKLEPNFETHWDAEIDRSRLLAAFNAYTTKADSYFMQFRVLHQVPELLARAVRSRVDALCRPSRSMGPVLEHLIRIRDLYRLVTESTQSMLTLMTPSEYHQIRRNLGVTSGSTSSELKAQFLGNNLMRIEAVVKKRVGNPSSKAYRPLLESIYSDIRREALLWRDFHIGFPRNSLGVGTTSLIGSPDAVGKPLEWRNEARQRGRDVLPAPPLDSE